MLWGIGTGRCGTKSLAKQMGGLHEPDPWINRYVCYWRFGADRYTRDAAEATLICCLEDRKAFNPPIVVDCHHSWVIPLIRKVDPEGSLVWIERDFSDTVDSFLRGGAFTKTDNYGRWLACPDAIAHSHPRKVCVEAHVSQLLDWIREGFDESKGDRKLRCPEDLTEWENRYPDEAPEAHLAGWPEGKEKYGVLDKTLQINER